MHPNGVHFWEQGCDRSLMAEQAGAYWLRVTQMSRSAAPLDRLSAKVKGARAKRLLPNLSCERGRGGESIFRRTIPKIVF
jgi:hypothetical protein